MELCRIVLILLAWKRKSVCKGFFYYESCIEILGFLLPQKVYADADTATLFWMQATLINFILLYCHFKASLAVSFLSFICLQVSRGLIYEQLSGEEIKQILGIGMIILIWLTVSLGVIHLLTRKLGL